MTHLISIGSTYLYVSSHIMHMNIEVSMLSLYKVLTEQQWGQLNELTLTWNAHEMSTKHSFSCP